MKSTRKSNLIRVYLNVWCFKNTHVFMVYRWKMCLRVKMTGEDERNKGERERWKTSYQFNGKSAGHELISMFKNKTINLWFFIQFKWVFYYTKNHLSCGTVLMPSFGLYKGHYRFEATWCNLSFSICLILSMDESCIKTMCIYN